MTTVQERIKASESASRFSQDLLEQTNGDTHSRALVEALNAIAFLRGAVRLQQAQIDNLLAAVPQADRKVTP